MSLAAQNFYSVGIDVGTTTTQIVFSRIFLEKTGGFATIPTVRIAKKDVVYKSKIYFTPLVSHDVVDADQLKDIVAHEYEKSKIAMEDVTTGAVIITGESARKENAHEVAQRLADFAGDFVVCTAGPDYEAVLAGWGSGAGEMSKKRSGNIVNFDIGGGTTNAAVFRNGEVTDAFAADIGGRLVRVNSDRTITYISDKIAFLLTEMGLSGIRVGQKAGIGELSRLTDRMAEMFLEFAGEKNLKEDTRRLFIGHPCAEEKVDCVMFSGGVAEYIYREQDLGAEESIYRYGDIGPLLGASIRRVLAGFSAALLHPVERIRATVVGAGSYSTGLSGSTVSVDEQVLPMKNIPVIKVSCSETEMAVLGKRISSQVALYDNEQVALAVGNMEDLGYAKIKNIAREIVRGLAGTTMPILVITERDFAKALGLLLIRLLTTKRPVVCLDKIHVENGDYIDIGRPICGVVPVIVKTLIFNS